MPAEAPLVLVVDDNSDIAYSTADLLEEEGFLTEIATDGAVALARLRGNGRVPSIVLSDIMMPQLSGYELLGEMRRNVALAHVPVVLMTALGVGGPPGIVCLSKPFDIDALLSAIRRALAVTTPVA